MLGSCAAEDVMLEANLLFRSLSSVAPENTLAVERDFLVVIARLLDRTVGRAPVHDQNLVPPSSVDLRHDCFHAVDLIESHHD